MFSPDKTSPPSAPACLRQISVGFTAGTLALYGFALVLHIAGVA